MAGSSEPKEFSFHKELGSLNYCIKINNGVALQSQKTSMEIKLETPKSFILHEEQAVINDVSLGNDKNVIKLENSASNEAHKEQNVDKEESVNVEGKSKPDFIQQEDESISIKEEKNGNLKIKCEQFNYEARQNRNLNKKWDAIILSHS